MRRINPMNSGLAVGTVVGLWHFIWVVLVGMGWAKSVMDFVLGLHFISLQYSLAPYAITTAGALVILTFVLGFAFGAFFALVWNWLGYDDAPRWATDSSNGVAAE